MSIKTFGASLATAALVSLPLAACGSSTPAPVVTVTATPSTTMHPALQKIQDDADRRWSESHPGQDVNAHRAAERAAAQQPKDSGLPWWSWLLIVPAALVALAVLGFKLSEMNDERTVARAWAKVDELDARAARRATRVLDYDDYEDDDEADELDELPEDDMEFLRKATDPTPAPAPSASPASGGLLSSLRNQGGAQ